MIQVGTYLRIVDNSGAKVACCIHIYGGFERRYANVGDVILVSVKKLNVKHLKAHRSKEKPKVLKGDVKPALIVQTKINGQKNGFFQKFQSNDVVLLDKQNRLIGNRIKTTVSQNLRTTKFKRMLNVCSGVYEM